MFGFPGGAVLPIFDAIFGSEIDFILPRHEQGAIHMADGYARSTGKVGVVLATSGPGATNLVTGLATAYMDSAPVVAITGQVPTSVIGTDAFVDEAVEQSRLLGMPDYEMVWLPHPVATLDEDGVRELARRTADQIVAMLTSS